MKTQKNILIAFILNLSFAIFEFFGGIFTGSIAIVSDSIHDLGDAASIGISYLLEKKSIKQPDEKYTYGYSQYSVIGGLITTVILLFSSIAMIRNAIDRIITPNKIYFNGMILFAVLGVCINFCAAIFTRKGESLNQKATNLHMLEDLLGWIVVLVGSIVMKFTDFLLIDPIMSIGVSLFILVGVIKNLKEVADLFLYKTPHNIDVEKIKKAVENIYGVLDVHHIHIWSMDGQNTLATMHIVTDCLPQKIKNLVREELKTLGIGHTTVEIETASELCHEKHCHIENHTNWGHTHHHSHNGYSLSKQ